MSTINKTICASSRSRFAVLAASIIIAMGASNEVYASSASGAGLLFGSSSTMISYNLMQGYMGMPGIDLGNITVFTSIFGPSLATVTSPVSFSGQTFDLNINGIDEVAPGAATLIGSSVVYGEKFSFGAPASFSLTQGYGVQNLFSANISGMTIYAVPGRSSAVIELNYTSASSNLLSVPPAASGYIDMTGSTSGPVTLVMNSANTYQEFSPFTLDWSGKVTSTPYSVSSVPEPGEWALMLGGLGLLGFIARRKTRNSATV